MKDDQDQEESDDVIDSLLDDIDVSALAPDTSDVDLEEDGEDEERDEENYVYDEDSEEDDSESEDEGEDDSDGDDEDEDEDEDEDSEDDEDDDEDADLSEMSEKELRTLAKREKKRSKDSRASYHRERNRVVELERQLEALQAQSQEEKEDDLGEKPDVLEDPDGYEEWVTKNAERRAKKSADEAISQERQRLREEEQSRAERQMKKDHSDYDEVVTEGGIKEINEDPMLYAAFQSLVKEHGNIARAAYESLKRKDRIRAALSGTTIGKGTEKKKRRRTAIARKSSSGRPLKGLKPSNDNDDILAGIVDGPVVF